MEFPLSGSPEPLVFWYRSSQEISPSTAGKWNWGGFSVDFCRSHRKSQVWLWTDRLHFRKPYEYAEITNIYRVCTWN